MARRFKPYDTYQVFFTINFDNQINCENAYTTNYLKTSNGIKYYNSDNKKYGIITDENTVVDWLKSLYNYNPVNEIIVLPDNFKDDGKHELTINQIDAGICNDRGQFTLRKSIRTFKD